MRPPIELKEREAHVAKKRQKKLSASIERYNFFPLLPGAFPPTALGVVGGVGAGVGADNGPLLTAPGEEVAGENAPIFPSRANSLIPGWKIGDPSERASERARQRLKKRLHKRNWPAKQKVTGAIGTRDFHAFARFRDLSGRKKLWVGIFVRSRTQTDEEARVDLLFFSALVRAFGQTNNFLASSHLSDGNS